MFKVSVLVLGLCLCLGLATSAATGPGKSPVSVRLVSSAELEKVLQQHPDAQPLAMEVVQGSRVMGEARQLVTYTLGARVSGDGLVSSDSGGASWASPTNVKLTITYPTSGVGAVISYVKIEVSQSNSLGQAYVTSGGIGQRFIEIIVEGEYTYWFNYYVYIYGQ